MNTHRNVVRDGRHQHWIGLTQADVILVGAAFHVTGLIGHVTLAMLTGSPLASSTASTPRA